jgi:predicted transcriptional regulator
MTTLELHLPDDLANQLSRLTNNAESYIITLLRSRVSEPLLAEEYRQAALENQTLLADFKHIDAEGWSDDY